MNVEKVLYPKIFDINIVFCWTYDFFIAIDNIDS